MKSITDSSAAAIMNTPGPVVIKFEAKWCQPCQAMTPVVLQVEQDLKGKVSFYSANVEHCTMIAQRYGVSQIPTLLAIENGVVTASQRGSMRKQEIMTWISQAFQSLRES